jgi:hypothetical protein
MQTRSKKNNAVVSVNPVRNIVTRSQTSGIKMTIVDDYLDDKNDEDYEYIEDCDDDDEEDEFNNIHKMKTRSKTSGKRQMFIDDDFVYNDDACDADWE